ARLLAVANASAQAESVLLRAQQAHPEDPWQRALFLTRVLQEFTNAEHIARLGGFVGINAKGEPFYKANYRKSVAIEPIPGGNTLRAFSKRRGRIPANLDVMVVGLHGIAAPYSHMGSMYYLLNQFDILANDSIRENSTFSAPLKKHLI